MAKRKNYFYQTLNDSGAAYEPTSRNTSVNNLFATVPITPNQKSMVQLNRLKSSSSSKEKTKIFQADEELMLSKRDRWFMRLVQKE